MPKYLGEPPGTRPPEPDIETRFRTSLRLRVVLWSAVLAILLAGMIAIVAFRLVRDFNTLAMLTDELSLSVR
jgi:hypothetical protein